MKLGPPVLNPRDGEAFVCIVPSYQLGYRRKVAYSYYEPRNELFRWTRRGGRDNPKYLLARVIPHGREVLLKGNFQRLSFCPKCCQVMVNHNANLCQSVIL